ncbi:very long chain fatty acid elongase 4-like [Augochlora pura]
MVLHEKIALSFWLILLLKIVDLCETVVFVLRKKDNQVSFLHLYHHVSMVLLSWMSAKYYPMKLCAMQMSLNCFVHIIMYTYYLLSSFGDKSPKFLKSIKPLITITQVVNGN